MRSVFDSADEQSRSAYEEYLKAISSLSVLFSESNTPYIDYRIVENLFCRCFNAENLSRSCIAVDARIGSHGIGIKTFVDQPVQKIAEFDKQREQLMSGSIHKDAERVAELRNERMEFCQDAYAIKDFTYHYVVRRNHDIGIHECPMDFIDTESIEIIRENPKGFDFTDGKNLYRFNRAKSTLFESFDLDHPLSSLGVSFIEDPMEAVLNLYRNGQFAGEEIEEETVILPLYSTRGTIHVPEKSGLNQWNAGGRARDYNEIYIPYQKAYRQDSQGFFPTRDTPFELKLPNGKVMSAKICQQDGKAIMSNPNKELGQWLLRDVLHLDPGQLVTLEMLEEKGINAVMFTKHSEGRYSIDFTYQDYDSGEVYVR